MTTEKLYPVSTYRYSYTGTRQVLSSLRYHEVPSIVHIGSHQLPPREFPVEPEGPVRHLQRDKHVCFRFSEPTPNWQTAKLSKIRNELSKGKEKDEVRGLGEKKSFRKQEKVFDTKYGKMDDSFVNSLAHRVRWKSATAMASEEACLPVPKVIPPITTAEPKADMVRLCGQRCETEASDWQKCVFWDRAQSRAFYNHQVQEKTLGQPEKLLEKRTKIGESRLVISDEIRHLVHKDELSSIYERQCPGYTGYVPRSPPKVLMEKIPEPPRMVSTMKGTYKRLPLQEYRIQEHAKKAPLSKTVTLTSPFNPYNKVVAKTPIR